jgi:hypothetical protein
MTKRSRPIRLLLGALAFAGVGYAGWVVGSHMLDGPQVTLDPLSQAGYCIAVNLSLPEKKTLAESLSRPSDPALVGRLLPLILADELTAEKRAASLAIRERDDLHYHSRQIISRLAAICGYDDLRISHRGPGPLELALSWLRYDPVFNSMLLDAGRQPPDAATRLDLADARNESRTASR